MTITEKAAEERRKRDEAATALETLHQEMVDELDHANNKTTGWCNALVWLRDSMGWMERHGARRPTTAEYVAESIVFVATMMATYRPKKGQTLHDYLREVEAIVNNAVRGKTG